MGSVMKIKKFIAPDIRRAIKMVRDEQGPDAVIISNRRVDGGVEIVSAIDYDESLLNQMDNDGRDNAGTIKNDKDDIVKAPDNSGGTYSHLHVNQNDQNIPQNLQRQTGMVDETLLTEMREELKYLRNIMENRFFDLEWANSKSIKKM